jgi:hypothetical protein
MATPVKRAKNERLMCSYCLHETNHTLLSTYHTSWSDDEADIRGGAAHDFLKCNGCETATLRIRSWFSEDEGTSVTLYPPRGSQEVTRPPKEFDEITFGGPLDSVYRQTVSAFNQKLLTLAGAGVRLIIEGVCKEKGTEDGKIKDKNGVAKRKSNLEGRINGLEEEGYISAQQAETLHQIRFLGNDAAHELDQPSAGNVSIALDIVEHLLEQVYEQPVKAKALAARKRPSK